MKYEEMDKSIGKVLRRYRKDRKLTVRAAGEMLELNNSTITRWETGENSIRAKDLLHYLDLLDRTYDEFILDLRHFEPSNASKQRLKNSRAKTKAKISASDKLQTDAV